MKSSYSRGNLSISEITIITAVLIIVSLASYFIGQKSTPDPIAEEPSPYPVDVARTFPTTSPQMIGEVPTPPVKKVDPKEIVERVKKESVVCTADVKLCPNGSYVSRTGESCEFAQCPGVSELPAEVAFGELTILTIGEQIKFSDGLTITLVKIEDSRCPQGVTCIWEGELSPWLRITGGNVGKSFKEIILGTVSVASVSENDYTFTLRKQDATAKTATIMVMKENFSNTPR